MIIGTLIVCSSCNCCLISVLFKIRRKFRSSLFSVYAVLFDIVVHQFYSNFFCFLIAEILAEPLRQQILCKIFIKTAQLQRLLFRHLITALLCGFYPESLIQLFCVDQQTVKIKNNSFYLHMHSPYVVYQHQSKIMLISVSDLIYIFSACKCYLTRCFD